MKNDLISAVTPNSDDLAQLNDITGPIKVATEASRKRRLWKLSDIQFAKRSAQILLREIEESEDQLKMDMYSMMSPDEQLRCTINIPWQLRNEFEVKLARQR